MAVPELICSSSGGAAVGAGDTGASELACVSAASDELAVADDAAAHPGADGDVAEVSGSAPGAELPFGDGGEVGVVVDVDRVTVVPGGGAGRGGRCRSRAGWARCG